MRSAIALAHKKDDRLRKEFEKWAILTYTNNRAIVNEKKGADWGVDGSAYILTGPQESIKMLIQVKSGSVERGDVAKLRGDMVRERAVVGTLITLEKPTTRMKTEANSGSSYTHNLSGISVPEIAIVTVQDIVENRTRIPLPASLEALWRASEANEAQLPLFETYRKKPSGSVDRTSASDSYFVA